MLIGPTTRYRTWEAKAWIDGKPYELAGLPSRSLGLDQQRSSCTLELKTLPPGDVNGKPAHVDVWVNGQRRRYFTGYCAPDSLGVGSGGLTRGVNLVDCLYKLNRTLKACGQSEGIYFNAAPWASAVELVLLKAGITAAEIHSIADPGSVYVVGAVESVCIEVTDSLASVFNELLAFAGMAAMVLPSGKVVVLPDDTRPAAQGKVVFSDQENSAHYPIYDMARSFDSFEQRINQFSVTGAPVTNGVTPEATWVASGVVGTAASMSNRFIQTIPQAQAIAEREGRKRVRDERNYSLSTAFDPDLLPGSSVATACAYIGLATTLCYVVGVQANGPAMNLALSSGPSQIAGYQINQPPLADLVVLIDAEPVIVNGQPEVRYFVTCDASASYDPDGDLTDYTWAVTGATPDPAVAAVNALPVAQKARVLFVLPTLTGVSISVTVKDDLGTQTDTATVALADLARQAVTRVLSVAGGSAGWRALLSIDEGWQTLTRQGANCTAVPTFNEEGPLLSGWSDGKLMALAWNKDEEAYATTLSEVHAFGSSITALFVSEGNPDVILVATGATLHRSLDGGTTWKTLKTFPATINDLAVSPVQSNEIRATTGNTAWISYDGSVFNPAVTGANGTVARTLAAAPWGHATVFTGTSSSADLVRFEEAYTVDWAAISPAPTDLYSITPLLMEEGFLVGDGAGKLYKLLKSGTVFTASLAVAIAGGQSRDGIRDGHLEHLSYWADAAGTYKLLLPGSTYQLHASPADQIGYGKLWRYVAARAGFVRATVGGSAGNDGVWYKPYDGAWTLRSTGLPTGWTWLQIAVCPLNPARWAVCGHNGTGSGGTSVVNGFYKSGGQDLVYVTHDAGMTWTGVPLPRDTTTTPAPLRCETSVCFWSASRPGQLVVAGLQQGGNDVNYGIFHPIVTVWHGTEGVLTARTINTYQWDNQVRACDGASGEVIVIASHGNWVWQQYYLPASGAAIHVGTVPTWGGIGDSVSGVVRDRMTNRLLMSLHNSVNDGVLYRSPDYRTTLVSSTGHELDAVNTYLAGVDDEGIGWAKTNNVFTQLEGLWASPSELRTIDGVSSVTMDSQDRSFAAFGVGGTVDVKVAHKQKPATLVAGPAAATVQTLGPLAVIDEG